MWAGAAVVALEPDDLGAGEILLEAQDVVHLGAAPAVDRLVVVADAADVLGQARLLRRRRVRLGVIPGRGRKPASPEPIFTVRGYGFRARAFGAPRNDSGVCGAARALPEEPQPEILRDVGVLILVHQNVPKPQLVLAQHLGLLAEQPDAFQQQVAEIGGVEHLQPVLIGGVELLALAAGEARRLAGRHLLGRQAAVLPAVDEAGEHARRPALLVDVLGFQQLLEQADLVVDVEDGEVALEAHQLGVAAQDLHADRMEGAEPRHALDHLADHQADAALHLARRLVGEGDRQDLVRPRPPGRQDVRDARGQHARLAGAGAGQHQHRPVQRLDRQPLLRIEVGEIGRAGRGARARGDAAGTGAGGAELSMGSRLRGSAKGAPVHESLTTRWQPRSAFARAAAHVSRASEASAPDLGFTDRHLKARKSGRPDLRGPSADSRSALLGYARWPLGPGSRVQEARSAGTRGL